MFASMLARSTPERFDIARTDWAAAAAMLSHTHYTPQLLPPSHGPQVYAQGMSVAAVSALTLDQALAAALAAVPVMSNTSVSKAGDSGSGGLEARRAAVRGMGPAFQKHLAVGEKKLGIL